MPRVKTSYAEKTAKYKVYNYGAALIGLSEEVAIPDVSYKTDSAMVAGGEIDDVIIGQIDPMEMELPFRQLYGRIYDLIDPTQPVDLTLRAANQTLDGAGNTTMVGTKIVVRGQCKGLTVGKYANGTSTGSSIKISVHYLSISENGVSKLEVDVLNGILRINGRDVMASVNALC